MILWLYCAETWGAAFKIPDDDDVINVKMQVWHDVLGDLPSGLVRAALVVAASSREFPPNPGQLREIALDVHGRESGDPPAPDVDQAWTEVRAAIGTFGRIEGPPEWSHPAVAAAVR